MLYQKTKRSEDFHSVRAVFISALPTGHIFPGIKAINTRWAECVEKAERDEEEYEHVQHDISHRD